MALPNQKYLRQRRQLSHTATITPSRGEVCVCVFVLVFVLLSQGTQGAGVRCWGSAGIFLMGADLEQSTITISYSNIPRAEIWLPHPHGPLCLFTREENLLQTLSQSSCLPIFTLKQVSVAEKLGDVWVSQDSVGKHRHEWKGCQLSRVRQPRAKLPWGCSSKPTVGLLPLCFRLWDLCRFQQKSSILTLDLRMRPYLEMTSLQT